MPLDTFNQRKKDVLSRQDQSFKGSWDKKISKLCEKINSLENYYTTSSCSGRILLMIDQEKKAEGLFKWMSHDLITFNEQKKAIQKLEKLRKNIKFKQEPCILHIACKTLKDANHFLELGFKAGLKKSGILYFGSRIIVELNASEKLEFPIIVNGKLIVDDNFLKIVVKKANENLENGWEKIKKLEKLVN